MEIFFLLYIGLHIFQPLQSPWKFSAAAANFSPSAKNIRFVTNKCVLHQSIKKLNTLLPFQRRSACGTVPEEQLSSDVEAQVLENMRCICLGTLIRTGAQFPKGTRDQCLESYSISLIFARGMSMAKIGRLPLQWGKKSVRKYVNNWKRNIYSRFFRILIYSWQTADNVSKRT